MSFFSPFQVIKERFFPVSPEQLWELVSDTEHLNRMIGLPAVTYQEAETSELGTFRWAEAKLPPFGLLRWKEFPFEWVKEKTYRVRRLFQGGPFREVYGGIDIEPVSGGSLLKVMAEFTPRTLLGRMVVSLVAHKAVSDTLAYTTQAIRVGEEKVVTLEPPMPRVISMDRAHLKLAKERLAQLASFPTWDIQRLIYLLEKTSDEAVLGMKPYALADRWKTNRQELLRLFLHATRAGLLELEWQLMCPACRVAKSRFRTLSEVTAQFHCDFCGIDITTDLDRSTELRFNVNPTIRSAQNQVYCVGSPAYTPHILCQLLLAPGMVRSTTVIIPENASEFRIRVLQRNQAHHLWRSTQPETPSRMEFVYDGNQWQGSAGGFAPGPFQFVLTNASDAPLVVVFEDATPDEQAVTAAYVTSLREFRQDFSAEVLAPGREIAIRRICFLFTDLKSTTALYEQMGDASALSRVQQHFEFLTEIVERHQGRVFKSAGASLMSVFYYAADAMGAALEIQSQLATGSLRLKNHPSLHLKVGLYQGPAMIITANEQSDYFGRTVHLASLMVDQSQGGDIVCSVDFFQEPDVAEVWQQYPVTGEALSVQIPGMKEPLTLYRLRLSEVEAQTLIEC